MNHKTSDSVGVNLAIEELKDLSYDHFIGKWGDKIDMYGRVYKNKKDGTMIPEFYVGGNEYKEVYVDDRKAATIIFLVGDKSTTDDEVVFTVPVSMVFMMNMELAYPNNKNRADERSHRDAIDGISQVSPFTGVTIKAIQTGLNEVFKGLDVSQIKFTDIHPLHCFAVNINLDYYLTNKCY